MRSLTEEDEALQHLKRVIMERWPEFLSLFEPQEMILNLVYHKKKRARFIRIQCCAVSILGTIIHGQNYAPVVKIYNII